ncbi:hypothetical protein AVEN_233496-1 [Araneus ventricosus]|uniref:Uncharacterized protein n=1 Tax=Araneus ventricosus TaxID=182803 RepID=A0A4Y2NAX9_ARAVE|nr:hypothetical protein AVEN_233496-1 [Araneus ventricosus]
MSQFVATKNPPWVRATAAGLVQPPPAGSSIITAQQISHASAAGTGLAGAGLGPGAGLPSAASLAGAGLAAGGANSLATAAAVVAAAQNQQAQQAPAVSASYGTGLAAITLTQSALQQGAMLQQQGIAIPASLAATTQVANVNTRELSMRSSRRSVCFLLLMDSKLPPCVGHALQSIRRVVHLGPQCITRLASQLFGWSAQGIKRKWSSSGAWR